MSSKDDLLVVLNLLLKTTNRSSFSDPVYWAVAHSSSLSTGFSQQAYWSGLPFPPPGDLPNPGIQPAYLMSPALAAGLFTTSVIWEAHRFHIYALIYNISVLLHSL